MRKRKQFKNDYEIRGNVAIIFLDRKDGTRLECLIDVDDLPKALSFPYKWSPHWNKQTESFYVEGKAFKRDPITGKIYREHFSLHRWILNPPKGYEVDHINHNTLDNRRCNLRLVPKGANQQNCNGARRSNRSSGIRGVSWNPCCKKWVAKYRLNKKDYHIGVFERLEDAEKAIKEARAKNMPYSLEAFEYKGGKVYENCNTYL